MVSNEIQDQRDLSGDTSGAGNDGCVALSMANDPASLVEILAEVTRREVAQLISASARVTGPGDHPKKLPRIPKTTPNKAPQTRKYHYFIDLAILSHLYYGRDGVSLCSSHPNFHQKDMAAQVSNKLSSGH